MYTKIKCCPNKNCSQHTNPEGKFYSKKGYFVTKWNAQKVPRYICKTCKTSFSTHTFRKTYQQKKPYLNEKIRRALSEANTIRGTGRELEISKNTVLKKLVFLGKNSREVCEENWTKPENKVEEVQFDELETSHRTQCLPLTIAFAIDPIEGNIITAHVDTKPCTNNLNKISTQKYGKREDNKEKAVRAMLRDVKKAAKSEEQLEISSDRWSEYRTWVKEELPLATYITHSGADLKRRERELNDDGFDSLNFKKDIDWDNLWIKRRKNGKVVIKAYDPLFHINQKCAVLRARLSRLKKRFWGFTQKVENLVHHLWLFIALTNKYKLKV